MKILKNKYLIIFIIILFFLLIFTITNYKNKKNGNNKNITEIENYILNINEYNANLEVTVTNNRNDNKYSIIQEVTNDYQKQKIEGPEEIKGMEIIYKNNKLEIKNSQLNLSKIYENYPFIEENNLFLTDFIKEYKESENKKIEELDDKIILMTLNSDKNIYSNVKKLYINKQNLKPEKIEILDNNNNIKVYILYNEIEINI